MSTVESTMNAAEEAVDQLNTPGGKDAGRFAEKAAQAKTILAELAALAPSAASEQLAAIKDSASWLYQEGSRKVKDAGAAALDTVKRRPTETVLVGVGLGLLTWWLMSRRNNNGREA